MNHNATHFLPARGEMSKRTQEFNWSLSSIGTFDQWPQSLRTMVSVILHSDFPMFLWWGPDMIQFYNDAYRPSFGDAGKHPQALGQKAKECWPEIWETIYPLIDKVRTTGESFYIEDSLIPINRNGRLEDVFWTFSYSAVIGEGGKIDGVLVVCNETTKKIETLKRLEESQRLLIESSGNLRNTIIHAPVAMCIFTGKQFIVEIANDRMIEFWGKTVEDVLNKPIFEGVPEAKNQGFEQLLEKVLTTGEAVRAFEIPVTLPRDGRLERVYVNFVYEAFRERNGKISGIMAVAHEVTEEVKMREKLESMVAERTQELNTANAELQRSNEDLQQFAHVISHDLKEPVRKIKTFSHKLLSEMAKKLPENAIKYMSKIESASDRVNTMIEGVLKYSSLNSQLQNLEMVDFNVILSNIVTDLEIPLSSSGAKIIADELPLVQGSSVLLYQLLYNLVNNSLKFCRRDVPCQVTITSHQLIKDQVHFAEILVRDNGIGFEPEYAEKIFDTFTRLNGVNEYEGTGLGLALCRKIVTRHHGEISASGKKDDGATFRIVLPFRQQTKKVE